MKLYLHIGTEKTGTTALQRFLRDNKNKLSESGFALLDSVGFPNNRNLVAYCQDDDHFDDFFQDRMIRTVSEKKKFQKSFALKFDKEIKKLPTTTHSVIISSEHFHSRLTSTTSLEKLYSILNKYFDDIVVLCYFREQSAVVKSLYTTSLKFGSSITFKDFTEKFDRNNIYFNYYIFFSMWECVFGREKLLARLYGKKFLINDDIRDDFLNMLSVDPSVFDFGQERLNESLGYAGAELARVVNSHFPRYRKDFTVNAVRSSLIGLVFDSEFARCGEVGFENAEIIYEEFSESNIAFGTKFLGVSDNPFDRPTSSPPAKPTDLSVDMFVSFFSDFISLMKSVSILEYRRTNSVWGIALRWKEWMNFKMRNR